MKGQFVDGIVRHGVPTIEENISTDFKIEEIAQNLKYIDIYFRSVDACPLGRGNWIVDLVYDDGYIFCLKLPKQMKEEEVNHYCQPVLSRLSTKH